MAAPPRPSQARFTARAPSSSEGILRAISRTRASSRLLGAAAPRSPGPKAGERILDLGRRWRAHREDRRDRLWGVRRQRRQIVAPLPAASMRRGARRQPAGLPASSTPSSPNSALMESDPRRESYPGLGAREAGGRFVAECGGARHVASIMAAIGGRLSIGSGLDGKEAVPMVFPATGK